jgi:hypothetical protein
MSSDLSESGHSVDFRLVPEPDLMPVHGLYDLAVVRGPLKCPLSLCRYGLTTKIT